MIIYLKTDTMVKWHAALVFAEKHGYAWFRGERPTAKYMNFHEKGSYLKLDINTKKLKRKINDDGHFFAEDKNYIVIEVI